MILNATSFSPHLSNQTYTSLAQTLIQEISRYLNATLPKSTGDHHHKKAGSQQLLYVVCVVCVYAGGMMALIASQVRTRQREDQHSFDEYFEQRERLQKSQKKAEVLRTMSQAKLKLSTSTLGASRTPLPLKSNRLSSKSLLQDGYNGTVSSSARLPHFEEESENSDNEDDTDCVFIA